MNNVNEKTLAYFNKVSKKLPNLEENILGEGEFVKGKTKLFDTEKEARTDARVQSFDESQTPPEELETVDDDIINGIIERKLDMILGD